MTESNTESSHHTASDDEDETENETRNIFSDAALAIAAINRAKRRRPDSKHSVERGLQIAGALAIGGVIWNPDPDVLYRSPRYAVNSEAHTQNKDMKHIAEALKIAGSVAISGAAWTRKDKLKQNFRAAGRAITAAGRVKRLIAKQKKYSIAEGLRHAGGIAIAGAVWNPKKEKRLKIRTAANMIHAIPPSDNKKSVSEALRVAGGVAIAAVTWNPTRAPKPKPNKFKTVAQVVNITHHLGNHSIAKALSIAASVAISGSIWNPPENHKKNRNKFKTTALSTGLIQNAYAKQKHSHEHSITKALEIAAGVAVAGTIWNKQGIFLRPEAPFPVGIPDRTAHTQSAFSAGHAQAVTPSFIEVEEIASTGGTPIGETPTQHLPARVLIVSSVPPETVCTPDLQTQKSKDRDSVPPAVATTPIDTPPQTPFCRISPTPQQQVTSLMHLRSDMPDTPYSVPSRAIQTPQYQRQETPQYQRQETQYSPSPVPQAAIIATQAKTIRHSPQSRNSTPTFRESRESRRRSPSPRPLVRRAIVAHALKQKSQPTKETEPVQETSPTPVPQKEPTMEEPEVTMEEPEPAPQPEPPRHALPVRHVNQLKQMVPSEESVIADNVEEPTLSNAEPTNEDAAKKPLAKLSKAEKLMKRNKPNGLALGTIKRSIQKFR